MKPETKKKLTALLHPVRTHYEERYRKRYRNARVLFIVDIALLAVILTLGSTVVSLLAGSRALTIDLGAPFRSSGVALALRAEKPERILRGSVAEIAIRYENAGPTALSGVKIYPEFPDTFEFTDPDTEWDIGDLASGASGTIRLRGIFRDATVRLGFRATAKRGGRETPVGEFAETIDTVASGITVADRYLSTPVVRPGETLSFEVGYENRGPYEVANAALGLEIENAAFIDWAHLPNAKRLDDSFLGVTANELPVLATARNGTGVTIAVPTNRAIPKEALRGGSGAVLRVRARLAGTVAGAPIVFVGKTREIKFASTLSLQAFARYYSPDGDQLGRGPLPPEVGETTKFWVVWHIENTTNEVSAVRVEGLLPVGVLWTERMSVSRGGAVSYDPTTRRVVWSVESVPPFPDEEDLLGASFEVSLTPTEAMIGTSPVLIGDLRIRGNDALAGTALSEQLPDVTTDLSRDIFGRGKGTVQ